MTECRSGRKQRYKCKKCRHRLGGNPGLGRRHTAATFITLALMLNGMGAPPLRVRIVPKRINVDVHADTIARWLAHYVDLVEEYTDPIRPPNLGSELGADDKRQNIRGGKRYFVMAMDLATRFILAWETTADKMDYDATRLLEAAKARAGKPCPILKTDSLSICHTAFKRVFGSLKGFFMYICDIHIRNAFSDTNRQERVNSTFAGRAKPARGINSKNSPAYRIFILDYNYIRPQGRIGGRIPAKAAGIRIQGHDKRLAPFQNAVVAA